MRAEFGQDKESQTSYMEEVLPEKKELDTEIVLDTMINVNEFLKN